MSVRSSKDPGGTAEHTPKFEMTDIGRVMHRGEREYRVARIRAVRDIPAAGVKAGDLGGFLEREGNLSHIGDAWVGEDAIVSDGACVSETAQVGGQAQVHGGARVFGEAKVHENAWIAGNAMVRASAQVSGSARVFGTTAVSGHANISGKAEVYGDSVVTCSAQVNGDARIRSEWVENDGALALGTPGPPISGPLSSEWLTQISAQANAPARAGQRCNHMGKRSGNPCVRPRQHKRPPPLRLNRIPRIHSP